MANEEFNYGINVTDGFTGSLDAFIAKLKQADNAFTQFQATTKGGAGGGAGGGGASREKGERNQELEGIEALAKAKAKAKREDAKLRRDVARETRNEEKDTDRAIKRQEQASRRIETSGNRRIAMLRRIENQENRNRAAVARVRAEEDRQFKQGIKQQAGLDAAVRRRQEAFRATPQGQAGQRILQGQRQAQVTDILARQGLDANGLRALTQGEKILKGIGGAAAGAAKSVGSLVVAFVAFRVLQTIGDAFRAVTSTAFEFNAKIETATLGVAALLTAVSDVRDVTGQTLTPAQKLGEAQKIAADQVKQLRKEALLTAASFEDLAEAFQIAVAPGINAGLDVDQVRQFAVQISQAASSLGVASNQLSEEIRSILSGTITARTTRIATALGITNEDIRRAREAGKLAEFLDKKFGAFNTAAKESANTFDVILSNLRDTFSQVLGEGSIGLFEEVKSLLKSIQDSLLSIDSAGNVIINPEAVEIVREIADAFTFAIKEVRKLNIDLGDTAVIARAVAEGIRQTAVAVRLLVKANQFITAPWIDLLDVITDVQFLLRNSLTDGIVGGTDDGIDLALARLNAFFQSAKALIAGFQAAVSPLDTAAAGRAITATGEAVKAQRAYEAVRDALDGVNDKSEKSNTILVRQRKSAEAVRDAIKDIREEIQRPAQVTAGSSGIFTEQTRAVSEYKNQIEEASRAQVVASETLFGLLRRAAVERGQEATTIARVKAAQEELNAAIKDRVELDREVSRLAVKRQVDAARQFAVQEAPKERATGQANLLKAQGREAEAEAVLRREREREAQAEITALFLTRNKTHSFEEQAVLAQRILGIQAKITLEAEAEFEARQKASNEEIRGLQARFGQARQAALVQGGDSAGAVQAQIEQVQVQAQVEKDRLTLAEEDSAALRIKLALIDKITALEVQGLQTAQDRADVDRDRDRAEELRLARNQQFSAQASALEEQASAGPSDLFRLDEEGRRAAGEEARRIRIEILRDQNIAEKTALVLANERLGVDKQSNEEIAERLRLLDETNQFAVDAIKRNAEQTPLRKGGTQTVGAEFASGINIDVLDASLATARTAVSSFSSFVSQSLFDAFNPDADLLTNFENFMESLLKLVLDTLIQIAVAKLVVAAINIGVGAATGGIGTIGAAGVGGIGATLGGAFGAAAGGSVGRGPYLASPAHRTARAYARGGRPSGLPSSDTVPAWLTPGEWVMRLGAVRKYGIDTMARINAGLVDPMGLKALAADSPRASTAAPAGLGRAVGGPAPAATTTRSSGPVEAFVVADEQQVARLRAGGIGADLRSVRKNRAAYRSALGL